MNNENPVKRAMTAKGLDTRDLATLIDADVAVVYRVLSGRAGTIPPKMRDAFAQLGMDPDRLSKQYKSWRNGLAMDILARVADVDGDPVKAEAILAELTASNKTAEV